MQTTNSDPMIQITLVETIKANQVRPHHFDPLVLLSIIKCFTHHQSNNKPSSHLNETGGLEPLTFLKSRSCVLKSDDYYNQETKHAIFINLYDTHCLWNTNQKFKWMIAAGINSDPHYNQCALVFYWAHHQSKCCVK